MRVTKQLVENMVTKIASEVNPTKCTCSVPWREEMKMLVQMWIQENISVEDGLTNFSPFQRFFEAKINFAPTSMFEHY